MDAIIGHNVLWGKGLGRKAGARHFVEKTWFWIWRCYEDSGLQASGRKSLRLEWLRASLHAARAT